MNYAQAHPHYRELVVDDHIRLITPDLSHAKESLRWVQSSEVVIYMGADFPTPSLAGEQKRIEDILSNGNEYSWMIEHDGTVIGNVCINMIQETSSKHDTHAGNLTILIGRKDVWGKGLGKKVCATVLDWAFTEGRFQIMAARALEENAGSIALLQKLGFQETGSEPYEGLVHGKPSIWRKFVLKNPHA